MKSFPIFSPDSNECHHNNSGCSYLCINTDASFYCVCPTGYTLGDDQQTCHDIDECENTDTCGGVGVCENTEGSYR